MSVGSVRLLLVMGSLRLPTVRLASLYLVSDIVYETLSPPLHLIQQKEVALGTTHPGEGAILYDGPHLRLIKLHKTLSVEQVFYSTQECHPKGGFAGHALQVAVEAQFGVDLHP